MKKFDEALKNGTGYRKAYKDIIASTNETTQQQAKEIERVTRQYKMGVMTQQQYNSSIKNITTSTRTLGTQQKITTATSKALSIALNSITTIGITVAMSLAVNAISNYINAEQEMVQSAKEVSSIVQDEISTIENLKEKYISILDSSATETEKNKELASIKETLIEEYKIEENSLKNINSEREKTIALLDEEISKKRKAWFGQNSEAYKASKETLENRDIKALQDTAKIALDNTDNIDKEVLDLFTQNKIIDYINEGDKTIERAYTTLSVESDDLIQFYETYKEIFDKLSAKEVTEGLSDNEKDILRRAKDVVSLYQQSMDSYLEIYNTGNVYTAEEIFSKFLSVDKNSLDNVNKDNVEQWKESLLRYVEQYGATKAVSDEVQKIMRETLKSTNIALPTEIAPEFTIDNEKIQAEVDKVNLIFSKTELDGGTSKNTVFDDLALIEKAMEEASKNGYIARESFEELITVYPELENVAKQTSKGYELSLLQMKNAEDDYLQNHKNTIVEARKAVASELEFVLRELKEAEQQQAEAMQGGYDNKEEIEKANHRLNTAKENYRSITNTISDFDNALDKLDYDTQINYLNLMAESCSVASGNMKMLSSAFAEINENGTLSVDTMISLIDSGYASALMYDANTKSVTLNRKQVELLAKTKIQSAKADLEAQLATEKHTEAIRQQIQAQINAYDMMLSQWNNIYDGAYGESPSEINSSTVDNTVEDTTDYYKENAEAQIKALKQQYELGYISSADYYNQLLDLVNYFYQGKTEYLDEYADYEKEVYDGMIEAQKERLEEQKEKIQEVNEENEKSIELIKAIQDLENAKKNKTIRSYSEERGWEYTTDTEAILEADQKLNQLLQEAKEKIIDKEIDAVEKMNLEELKNALNSPLTSLPTNEDIINTAKQQSLEYITNAINNNNQSMNYSINIQNLNTNNPNDFLNQMSNLFNQLSNDTVLGR